MAGWGWAVWQFAPGWLEAVTSPREESPPQEPPGPVSGTLRLIAESPLPPTLLTVTVDGQPFLHLEKSGVDLDLDHPWVYPPEGMTAELRAEWKDYLPGPRAVRVRAFFDGVLISDVIAWGRDEALQKTWRLPGAEEILATETTITPGEQATPRPGESDPAVRPLAEPAAAPEDEVHSGAPDEPGSSADQIFALPPS